MTTDLRDYTRQFAVRDNKRAMISFGTTFAVYFGALTLAIAYAHIWYILVPFGLISGLAAVRLYVLQHDTGHHSLFETRLQNEIAGNLLSPFTFAPFEVMKQNHNLHHASIGNLDHRETGEINTMTVREWHAAPWRKRLFYRLYRNPFILIPLGSLFTYFIRYRWPKNTTRFGIVGVLLHNLAVAGFVGLIYWLSGWTGVLVWFVFSAIGGMFGVFLVYLQHNFEDTYWDRRPGLDPQVAALKGSSALDFGEWFDIMVACITLHDIHHFNARIPSYRLRECHYGLPPQYAPRRIKFGEAVAALNLKLWDEERERLVPFPKAAQNPSTPGPRPA